MTCRETKSNLIDHALGELPAEVEIQVNEHLSVCQRCRAEFQEIGKTIGGIEEGERFKPAAGVYRRISDGIIAPKPNPSRVFGIPKSLVFAFGAFLLGIVLTRSIETVIISSRRAPEIEVRQQQPQKVPFSDTVEFYSVPAKNLARI